MSAVLHLTILILNQRVFEGFLAVKQNPKKLKIISLIMQWIYVLLKISVSSRKKEMYQHHLWFDYSKFEKIVIATKTYFLRRQNKYYQFLVVYEFSITSNRITRSTELKLLLFFQGKVYFLSYRKNLFFSLKTKNPQFLKKSSNLREKDCRINKTSLKI